MSEQGNEIVKLAVGWEHDLRMSRGRRQGNQVRNYSNGSGKIL